jgi:hypothetical protein
MPREFGVEHGFVDVANFCGKTGNGEMEFRFISIQQMK